MLTGVDQELPDTPSLEGGDHRRGLREVRSGTRDVQDQRGHAFLSTDGPSGGRGVRALPWLGLEERTEQWAV
ncbi:hypothetical protein GCM10023349_18020 [Nocardioides conyzicola]|uniref:Uncharacterized protein n=1 Tax=Nocardioides conyzicola TaxID=1651781 RepID=A0ABP8X6A9_9ACTN